MCLTKSCLGLNLSLINVRIHPIVRSLSAKLLSGSRRPIPTTTYPPISISFFFNTTHPQTQPLTTPSFPFPRYSSINIAQSQNSSSITSIPNRKLDNSSIV